MKNSIILIALILVSSFAFAQESNNGKRLWAKSILNEKAPELVVEEWISQKPDTKGKFVLIDFWATWCGPCRKAIGELNELQKQFKDDLVVIGISDETADKVKGMASPVIEYYNGIDTNNFPSQRYLRLGSANCRTQSFFNPILLHFLFFIPYLRTCL